MVTYNETPVSRPAHRNNSPHEYRPGRRPLGWVDHHIVGSLPGCTAHFQNPDTGYATNYGIGSADGRGGGGWWIHEYVPADEVAWGNGNTFLNTYGVSVEHENNLAVAINAKPVHEVHELSARFMAALAIRFDWRIDGKVQLVVRDFPNHDFYGKSIPGFGTEFNVITHRSVALKDCPRDLDIYWKAARANQIIAASGTAGLGYAPIIPFHAKPYGRNTKERDMLALKIIDGAGKLGPVGKTRTYVVGGGFFIDTTNHATRDQVSVVVQGYDADGEVAATPNLTYRELYDYAKASHALSDAELAPYKAAAGVA